MTWIIASHVLELKEIHDRIHDRWFSVDDIVYDTRGKEVLIPFVDEDSIDFRVRSSVQGLAGAALLVFRNVTAFEIKDTEHVRWYDFNRLKYDGRTGIMTVMTNIPIVIQMHLLALDVRVRAPVEDV